MSDTPNKPKQSLGSQLAPIGGFFVRYLPVWFAVLLAIVYGYVLYNLQAAVTAEPSQSSIDAKVQSTATPHVDSTVVDQMQSLQDHSVSVQSLFDQARSNPFQE